ncbi:MULTISPECIES: NUDIX hydrolase [unclassified Butyrivibrio]|uniref:NUDIX hydrolase n=1 Tax=unclassified Butyrivibrio TaxID=2639466 RepID=UPI0004130262|nr:MULTISPECIES: NUDIX hydrolase [unclassified Butyrivibrio]
MATINSVEQLTENRFVNLFHVKGENDKGHQANYYVASRSKTKDDLMITTGKNVADGVSIYALCGENKDKVVLVRQYRYPIDTYIYEFPAGLCEPGEDYKEAAVRELHEETGLDFHPLDVDPMYELPRFSSVGMTDESVAMVFGYADGKITDKYQEASEEIQVVIADRDEVRRILREEHVAILAAYQLQHFLHDEDPFAFLQK